MATDTVTNFISPTQTVFSWVQTQLSGVAGFANVDVFKETDEQMLFNWIIKSTKNQCMIKYEGSKYSNQGQPRREMSFSVYIVCRYMTNIETAQTNAFTLLDSTIGALDHNGTADFRVLVQGDQCVDFPDAGLTVIKVAFVCEDY